MIEVDINDHIAWVTARKRELGITDQEPLALNDGSRRTPSKRALLQAIADNARAQGREPTFKANFEPI
jgi:hypothetical protein